MLSKRLINTAAVSIMELRQLRYFLALAEHLHFGDAAHALHITQPPLSRQIAAMEEELGVRLFDRHSRAVSLTPAGRAFVEQARTLLAGLDQAMRSARATARGERGQLRIGFTSLAAWTLLPGLLRRFSDRYPEVELLLSEVLPRDLDGLVVQGEVDLALSLPGPAAPGLAYRTLRREPLCAALPSDHPAAAGSGPLKLQRLRHSAFISFPPQTAPALHEAVLQACREAGFDPHVRLRTHLQQTIVNLVAEGLGVALVPASISRLQLPGVSFRPIVAAPSVEYGASWLAANRHPCLVAFLQLLPATPA